MSEKSSATRYPSHPTHLPQCACVITEFAIRGAATLDDIISSITQNYQGSALLFP